MSESLLFPLGQYPLVTFPNEINVSLTLELCRSHSLGSATLDPPLRSPRLSSSATPSYVASSQGYYTYNAATPPSTTSKTRKIGQAEAGMALGESLGPPIVGQGDTSSMHPLGTVTAPWKRKLSQTMRHLVVSPRFHRKRYDSSSGDVSSSAESPQV